MIELRDYQEDAKQAFYAHLRDKENNPCVVIPTAGGKTPILASICSDAVTQWQGRVLVLAHVKELVQQAADKLNIMCPGVRYGVYSAGLNRREYNAPVVVAGIQSVYQRAAQMGSFDLILVDEAHMIPPDGDGRYRQFIGEAQAINPNVRVGGFTATPYRLGSGPLCSKDGILNEICYEVGVKELMARGYLSKVTSKAAVNKADISGIEIKRGEYDASQMEAAFNVDDVVRAACKEIVSVCSNRKSILVFTSGVDHCINVVDHLSNLTGERVEFITGTTDSETRAELLAKFKDGLFRWLVNVNVLTTGFDAPNIDSVVLLRSTLSPGLYYQMVGRGFRLFAGKENCLVLDFGSNITRHGPVDKIRVRKPGAKGNAPAGKECPECQEVVAIGVMVCTCGHVFASGERGGPKHDSKSSKESILSGETARETHPVQKVYYSVHTKKGDKEGKHPKTMRVDYQIGLNQQVSEWVCIEHTGYAGDLARAWWRRHSRHPVPSSAAGAVALAKRGALAAPSEITILVTSGSDWPKIVQLKLGMTPPITDLEPPDDDDDWLNNTPTPTNADTSFSFGSLETDDLDDEIPF